MRNDGYAIEPPADWPERSALAFRRYAGESARVLAMLGLDAPLDRLRLGRFLEEMAETEPRTGPSCGLAFYRLLDDDEPRSVQVTRGFTDAERVLHASEPEWTAARGNRLYRLAEIASAIATATGCEPAEVVAFLLCEAVPTLPWIRVIPNHRESEYGAHLSLSIVIESLDVPLDAVRGAYKEARERLLGPDDWRARRASGRSDSVRRVELLSFVERRQAEGGSWNQMFEEWNASHALQYRSVQSMKNVHYAHRVLEKKREEEGSK
jgi:hypothetical protein